MTKTNGLLATQGLELLSCGTPSGYKVSILLEELKETYGKEYTIHPIDIFNERKHKEEWYTAMNPNGRIPILVDHDNGDIAIWEGAAILQYLGRTYDKDHKFSFPNDPEQASCEAWISFAQAHVYAQLAECVFFNRFATEHSPFAIHHFVGEAERLFGVIDKHLKGHEYLVGNKFSIADIAVFAAVDVGPTAGIDRTQWPDLLRWWNRIRNRSAVKKGSVVPNVNPFLGEMYQKRLQEEPGFKEQEEEMFLKIEQAKQQYGYKYSSP